MLKHKKSIMYISICLLEIIIPIIFFVALFYCVKSDPITILISKLSIGFIVMKILLQFFYHIWLKYIKKKVSYYLSVIPKLNNTFFESLLRKKIGNEENTFSLYWGFESVDVQNIRALNKCFAKDELSINGLVGENNQEEKASIRVKDEEVEDYIETIKQWQGDIPIGHDHLLENESDKEKYIELFTMDNIFHYINKVDEETKGKGNTFNFIADQYGVFSTEIDKKKRCLTLYVYKTNYFTFRVMNCIFKNTPILQDIAKKMCLNKDNDKLRKEGFKLLFPFFASLGTNIIMEVLSRKRGEGFLIQKRNDKVFGSSSQYHVSVNETFSFTDKSGDCPDIPECVRRGIEEELGLNLEDEWKKDVGRKRITYMDIFLNPDRGSLGLSIIYKTDINPSIITYYPGVDKVIEASKHVCVFGVDNYKKMLNFISLYNWIVYTPYLLKQYAIYKQGWLDKLVMIWNLDKGENLFCEKRGLFWVTLLYNYLIIAILFISLYFTFVEKNYLTPIICLPLYSLWEKEFWSFILRVIAIWKIKKNNIDYISPGDYPYKDALLYTGIDDKKNLESIHISLALKSTIDIPFDKMLDVLKVGFTYDFTQYFKSVFKKNIPSKLVDNQQTNNKSIELSWDTINITTCRTGVRHVSKDEEYPALILQGYISSHNTGGKELLVREYYIEQKATKYIIHYNDIEPETDTLNENGSKKKKKNQIRFGYDYPFKSVFDIVSTPIKERQNGTNIELINQKDSNLSLFALDVLKNDGYDILGHFDKEMKMDLHLCDIYQSPNKDKIIISSYRVKKSNNNNFKKCIEADADHICSEIMKLINNKENDIDRQDILMLQQILLRKKFNIKLFYHK